MTSTRELANRLRSALGWIDAHADHLPGGWGFTSWAGVAGPSMSWLHADATTVETLTHLLGDPEVDGDGEIFTWRAEGDRPGLNVYTDRAVAA